jgi:hypothetical protein
VPGGRRSATRATHGQLGTHASGGSEWEAELARHGVSQAFTQALADIPAPAQDEISKLFDETLNDLRLQLLKRLDESDRDIWSAVLAMQSSEGIGSKLAFATGLFDSYGLIWTAVILLRIRRPCPLRVSDARVARGGLAVISGPAHHHSLACTTAGSSDRPESLLSYKSSVRQLSD